MDDVLETGSELVGNVRVAADNLQVQYRERIERRNEALRQLLEKEEMDTEEEFLRIQENWPGEEVKKLVYCSINKLFGQSEKRGQNLPGMTAREVTFFVAGARLRTKSLATRSAASAMLNPRRSPRKPPASAMKLLPS